jgi:hypothetical protein
LIFNIDYQLIKVLRQMNLKIIISGIFSFWLAYGAVWGQNKNYLDVVYLKNGSIVRGKIIEQTAEKTIIQTRDHNRWVFTGNEVERVAAEPRPFFIKKSGYLNYIEAGVLSGTTVTNINWQPENKVYSTFSLQIFQGHQFHPAFGLGFTTGLDWYHNQTILPVAVGIRGDFSQKRITPTYGVDFGYGLGWLNEQKNNKTYSGGTLFALSMGIKIRTLSQTSFLLSLGYRQQLARSNFDSPDQWGIDVENNETFNRLVLKFGVGF